jgi:hypothetical protein
MLRRLNGFLLRRRQLDPPRNERPAPAPRSQARRPTWEEGPAVDIQTKHEFWIIAVSTVAMVVACAIAFAVFAQLLDF